MPEEKTIYPQIPSTVWWGVRQLLQLKPTAVIDEKLLSVHLGVQEVAAKAYLKQLQAVCLLDENNKATALAQKWRIDQSYSEAVEEILSGAYPESLLVASPPNALDRDKAVQWFMLEGLGKGSAGNKAATYALIASPTPQDASNSGAAKKAKPEKASSKPPVAKKQKTGDNVAAQNTGATGGDSAGNHSAGAPPNMPLNVNVQIHISADASGEQIDRIFKSMSKYLYDREVD